MSDKINVLSKTQVIYVEPPTGAVAVINVGPQGPAGLPGSGGGGVSVLGGKLNTVATGEIAHGSSSVLIWTPSGPTGGDGLEWNTGVFADSGIDLPAGDYSFHLVFRANSPDAGITHFDIYANTVDGITYGEIGSDGSDYLNTGWRRNINAAGTLAVEFNAFVHTTDLATIMFTLAPFGASGNIGISSCHSWITVIKVQ